MPKGLKILAYILTGLISFVLFLYLTFPFDVLKDRMLADVEKRLKGQYEINVGSISPRLLLGVTLKSVQVMERGEGGLLPVIEAERIKLKTSLFSVIFGNPKIKFDVKSGKGRMIGEINNEKNKTLVDVEIESFDLGKIPIIARKTGLQFKSKIDAEIKLDLNPSQILRSSGSLKIIPNKISVLASKLKAGAMGEIDIPPMVIGAGDSLISAELKRGAIKVGSLKLEEGDLNLNLGGSIYLSSSVKNFRLNLRGDFDFSEKVGQALPFLFIIEKQKNEAGKYPLTIAGRLAKPQIKIGDFTVPM